MQHYFSSKIEVLLQSFFSNFIFHLFRNSFHRWLKIQSQLPRNSRNDCFTPYEWSAAINTSQRYLSRLCERAPSWSKDAWSYDTSRVSTTRTEDDLNSCQKISWSAFWVLFNRRLRKCSVVFLVVKNLYLLWLLA